MYLSFMGEGTVGRYKDWVWIWIRILVKVCECLHPGLLIQVHLSFPWKAGDASFSVILQLFLALAISERLYLKAAKFVFMEMLYQSFLEVLMLYYFSSSANALGLMVSQ